MTNPAADVPNIIRSLRSSQRSRLLLGVRGLRNLVAGGHKPPCRASFLSRRLVRRRCARNLFNTQRRIRCVSCCNEFFKKVNGSQMLPQHAAEPTNTAATEKSWPSNQSLRLEVQKPAWLPLQIQLEEAAHEPFILALSSPADRSARARITSSVRGGWTERTDSADALHPVPRHSQRSPNRQGYRVPDTVSEGRYADTARPAYKTVGVRPVSHLASGPR